MFTVLFYSFWELMELIKSTGYRQVPVEEGAKLAKELKSAFVETSAKNNYHIREFFFLPSPPPSPSSLPTVGTFDLQDLLANRCVLSSRFP